MKPPKEGMRQWQAPLKEFTENFHGCLLGSQGRTAVRPKEDPCSLSTQNVSREQDGKFGEALTD